MHGVARSAHSGRKWSAVGAGKIPWAEARAAGSSYLAQGPAMPRSHATQPCHAHAAQRPLPLTAGGQAGGDQQQGHGAAAQAPVHLGRALDQAGEEPAPLRRRRRHQHAFILHKLLRRLLLLLRLCLTGRRRAGALLLLLRLLRRLAVGARRRCCCCSGGLELSNVCLGGCKRRYRGRRRLASKRWWVDGAAGSCPEQA